MIKDKKEKYTPANDLEKKKCHVHDWTYVGDGGFFCLKCGAVHEHWK